VIPEWAMVFCRKRKVKLSIKQCLEDYQQAKAPVRGAHKEPKT